MFASYPLIANQSFCSMNQVPGEFWMHDHTSLLQWCIVVSKVKYWFQLLVSVPWHGILYTFSPQVSSFAPFVLLTDTTIVLLVGGLRVYM